jgi:hypothetical protein
MILWATQECALPRRVCCGHGRRFGVHLGHIRSARQFGNPERLDHVIVSVASEELYLTVLVGLYRQHDDWLIQPSHFRIGAPDGREAPDLR